MIEVDSPGCSLALAPSGVSILGCWLCVPSCLLGGIGCWPSSGPLVGTLLALCSCFFDTFETRTEAIGYIGFVPVLLLIPDVDDLESEKVFRFFRSATSAPKPWANTWWPSWWCAWCEWWEWCVAWTSCPGVSNEDFESVDPSDLDPPSSEAGEYTESSERDLPEKSREQLPS